MDALRSRLVVDVEGAVASYQAGTLSHMIYDAVNNNVFVRKIVLSLLVSTKLIHMFGPAICYVCTAVLEAPSLVFSSCDEPLTSRSFLRANLFSSASAEQLKVAGSHSYQKQDG